jgi:TRAP-type C4-dicarboxylate transport system permease small subunit
MRSPIRFVALLILVIPGALGVYGWTLMRNSFFTLLEPDIRFQWLYFFSGLFLFVLALLFIGGFIFYRDKKRKRVQNRFLDDIND